MVGRCSHQTGCFTIVPLIKGVDDCDIPRKCLSSHPWNECRSIRSLAVITREANWLLHSGNLSSLYESPNNVIQVRVSLMSGCTFRQERPCIYRLAAGTGMLLTSSRPKPCTNRYPDHLVSESQSYGCDGRGMKPIARVFCTSGVQTRSIQR